MPKVVTFSLALFAIFGISLCGRFALAQRMPPAPPKPTTQHEFLKNFVGDWDCEMESFPAPEQTESTKHKSTISGAMIGDLWVTVTIQGTEHDGRLFTCHGTFGFDSKKNKAIGTLVNSNDEHLWNCEGKIEDKKLIVNANGPSKVAYRDTWDFSASDKIVFTNETMRRDGTMGVIVKIAGVKRKPVN